MKNSHNDSTNIGYPLALLKKTPLFLKLIALLVALSVQPLQASTNAQVTVTLSMKSVMLSQVLNAIEKQTDYRFYYNNQLINTERQVSVDVRNEDVFKTLDKLFVGTNVQYKVVDKDILLTSTRPQAGSSIGAKGDKRITGKVVDNKGEPVIGANISVKGTTIGTITDIDGIYQLEVPTNGTLQVSYIGYITQTTALTGTTTQYKFILMEDAKSIEEVVIVGYGIQKRVNLSGAISTVGGKELGNRVVTNPSSLLQGQLPGLQVTASSGEPGKEDISMVLRGRSSFGGSLEPLIIVDGIPVTDMNAINPAAIESVTALKDAASSAIYGSRAAGGVILITTKQGQEGKEMVTVDANLGLYSPARFPELITNSADYMTLYNTAKRNRYGSAVTNLYDEAEIAKYRNANGDPRYPNTDWANEVFRPALVQNYNIGISGGGKRSSHNIVLGVINQPGTMQGFNYSKYTLQMNLTSKPADRIAVGATARAMYSDRKSVGGSARSGLGQGQRYSQNILNNAINQAPTYGSKLPSGEYVAKAYANETPAQNPFVTIENTPVDQQTLRLETTGFVKVDFFDWLQWETRGGFNMTSTNTHSFSGKVMQSHWWDGSLPPRSQPTGAGGDLGAGDANNSIINPLLYTTLNFQKRLGDHDLSALAGYQMEYNRYKYFSARREDFLSNAAQEIDAGQQTKQYAEGNASELALMSLFGRISYNYKSRYFAEFNVRADGSSRFSPEKRWGTFPSLSLAWRPLEEAFIPEVAWISDLKVRGSYGILGNQSVGDYYLYQQVLSPGTVPGSQYSSHDGLVYVFDKTSPTQGFGAAKIVDPNLSWETTYSSNVGVDVALFKNSLTFSLDLYHKKIVDILVPDAKLPYSSGFSSQVQALGSMQNKGIEFNINYRGNIQAFTYGINWNIYANRNKVIDYPSPGPWGKQIYAPGYEYGAYFLNVADGVRQRDEEVILSDGKKHILPAGTLRILDIHDANSPMIYGMGTGNPDGIVSRNTDRVICKGAYPDFESGLTLNGAWKGFDVAASFYGVFGVKQYIEGAGWDPFKNGIAPPSAMWKDAYTDEKPSATVPRISFGDMGRGVWYVPQVQDGDLERNTFSLLDGSYVRMKNLNVGYTFYFPKVGLQSLRVYFAGDNLFTITKFPGDPERQTGPYTDGTAARDFNNDFLRYPQNRIYSIGFNAKF